MLDDEILRLHKAGFVTGAIAVRLSVESSYVRSVVRTHLKTVAQVSKPQYGSKAEAKVAKALAAVQKAEAELRELNAL